MKFTYYVKGFECESCARVISRVVSSFPGASLTEANQYTGAITIECEPEDEKQIIQAVREKGYSLSTQPLQTDYSAEKSPLENGKNYVLGLFEGKHGFQVEQSLLQATLLSFLLTIGAEVLASIILNIPLENYKWLFALSAVAVSANAFAVWHSIAYRKEFTCMNGMMVGMALGMMTGFMVGAVVAASSGMFVGSVVGMLFGMAIGAYTGYCCGIMGVLEGLMAGLMSGIMGAMTTIMLLNDHVIAFLFILFAACTVVLAGLSYMIWKEAGGREGKAKLPSGLNIVAANVAIGLILVLIMVYAPKGPLAWVGFGG